VFRVALRLTPPCSFAAVREAAQTARQWLAEQNLLESELAAWELVLVEAGNNAVEHAPSSRRVQPLEFEVSCGETDVEARITDHTDGFDFPDRLELPDVENEGQRGLFLIRSLTDHAEYWRGRGRNTLVLRKRRADVRAPDDPDALALQRRLAESEAALADMAEELASSYESLVALFRFSAELGACNDFRDFAKRLLGDLAQLAEADAVIMRLLAPGGRLETHLAWPEDLGDRLSAVGPEPPADSMEWKALQTREDIWFDGERPPGRSDPLHGLPHCRVGVVHAFGLCDQPVGTITLGRRTDRPFRSAQINLLHTFADFLGIQRVNARLLDERTQVQITRRELEIAANIQRSLLPVELPSCLPFELAAACLNAREVGGDYYDAIPAGERGVLLVIADVMGKGVPAALFAALLRSTVRSMPALFTSPAALLTAVNRTLCEDLERVDMFATAKVAWVDTRRAEVTCAGAGHAPLLVWLPGTLAAEAADGSDFPLGIDRACEYSQTTVPLPPGAVALLYTDGVTESRDPSRQLFGEDRLRHLLPRLSPQHVSADALCRAFLTELDRFRAGAPQLDDQTLILLRHIP